MSNRDNSGDYNRINCNPSKYRIDGVLIMDMIITHRMKLFTSPGGSFSKSFTKRRRMKRINFVPRKGETFIIDNCEFNVKDISYDCDEDRIYLYTQTEETEDESEYESALGELKYYGWK